MNTDRARALGAAHLRSPSSLRVDRGTGVLVPESSASKADSETDLGGARRLLLPGKGALEGESRTWPELGACPLHCTGA